MIPERFNSSVLEKDYDNLAATVKSVMRLCAFAMVANGTVDDSEADVIATILVRRYINKDSNALVQLAAKLDIAHVDVDSVSEEGLSKGFKTAFDCKPEDMPDLMQRFAYARAIVDVLCGQFVEEPDTRKSIFMNLDSLGLGRISLELFDMMLVARADSSLLDSEREAFRVFCKILRVAHSTSLWQDLSQCNEDELWLAARPKLKIEQKPEVDVNDYKSIEQSISFYNIKGPFVDGSYYALQREQVRHRDHTFHSDRQISKYTFWLFVCTAAVAYLRISCKWHFTVNSLLGLEGHAFSWKDIDFGMILLLVLGIGWLVYLRSRRKKIRRPYKRNLGVTVAAVASFFVFGFSSMPLCVLAMMVSVEWLIFMREQMQHDSHKGSSAILIILVAAAIIADICLGLVEHFNMHPTESPNYISIIASALFLGCICFFFGKWLENRRMEGHQVQKQMEEVVESIGARIDSGCAVRAVLD